MRRVVNGYYPGADASFVWPFTHFSLAGSPFGTVTWTPDPTELIFEDGFE